jgi:ATP-dependent exoDNAse (exonuclease V) beta subunit
MTEAGIHDDAAARMAAVDPHRSILLQAPAGSGKTAVLTQRYLRLLCEVQEPGAILAITFTRKAAAEMRGRVMRALRGEIAAEDPNAPALRALAAQALQQAEARGWRLLENPGALRIQTIDSFNYWLASQLPVAARVGGALEVTEGPAELYRRAARRTLAAADADAELAADADLLFERFDNNWGRLEHSLAAMLQQRAHWLRYVLDQDPAALCARVNASLCELVSAELAAARQLLGAALRAEAERLPEVGSLAHGVERLSAWQRLASLALTKAGGFRRSFDARHLDQGDPHSPYADRRVRQRLRECVARLGQVAGLETRLQVIAELPAPVLSAADSAAIGALSRLLRRAAAELHLEFAAAERVDYTFVTGAAREALTNAGEPTELALRTGLALRHILVDEFQDTSLAQFELLEQLTAGWEPGDGRTLFVVGDPMQSIYRFRDAEVGLFIAAREQGIGTVRLTPLQLTRNFRSAPGLVEWINQVFSGALAPADDLAAGAVAFCPSIAAGAARAVGSAREAQGVVTLNRFNGDPRAEAAALAGEIARLRSADADATIAVLVAAHAYATPIAAALQARGVECLGVDLVPLRERSVVRDLVALTRALYDLGDRAAWLTVLRAPWCGASLATLTALSRLDDAQLVWESLVDPARLAGAAPVDLPRVARLRAVLESALVRRGSAPPADWLESTWLGLGGADAYTAEELEDAHAFFAALATRAATRTWQGPEDYPALLQDLFSAPRAAQPNAVQIMTMHRAKGLEFDHVFLPALDRAADAGRAHLLEWIDIPRAAGGSDLLMAPAAPPGAGGAGRTLLRLIRRLNDTRADHERARLMYVAATRARRSLHLSASPAPDAKGEPKILKRSLLECLWPQLEGAFARAPAATPAPGEAALLPLRRLVPGWQLPPLPPAPPLERLPLPRAPLAPEEFSWVGETQRHVGTIVHAWLARIADSGRVPTRAEIEAQGAAMLAELRRHGVPAAERPPALELILQALSGTLADERGKWILASHRQARSELPLTGLSEGRLRSVVIDRCFVDEHGTRWVIDYKTSRHEGGALDAFLASELERYRPQLETYAELARGLGPEPVRVALYFPLLAQLRELTASR